MGLIAFLFSLLSIFFFSFSSSAEVLRKLQSPQELEAAINKNRKGQLLLRQLPAETGFPVLETDSFRYLLLKGDDENIENLYDLQKTFATNLPEKIILVVVTESSKARQVKNKFLKWLPEERLIVASGDDLGDVLWGRDSYPYPVYEDDAKSTVKLVAHKYFRRFSARDIIAKSVGATNVSKPGFIAVGGNIMSTAKGECLIIDSERTFGLDDLSYKAQFHCKSVVRFPWLAGIGDVDEVIKVLANDTVLTNQEAYVGTLQALGYKVVMLPKPGGKYRTYANSVILENTVFMPVYGDPNDDDAKSVYESFGYKVVGIKSNNLSDNLLGSVHCLTMTYPDMNQQVLIKTLGLRRH